VIFKQGKIVDQWVGTAPKEQIRQLIEKHLS
jgi:thioredoxin-like negative regulator of GroEL